MLHQRAGAGRLLNLCFHGIGTPQRPLEPGEDAYWISECTYLEVLDAVADRPDVCISFDDGNSSDVRVGLPALVERGMTASFFVLAGRLGQPGSLGIEDLVEMRRHGMTIGNHGMDHRPWSEMAAADRHVELVEARSALEQAIGETVATAALPLGRYNRAVLRDLRRVGYSTVYTSDRRWAQAHRWLQPRYSVRCNDTAESLLAEVLSDRSTWRASAAELRCALKRLR